MMDSKNPETIEIHGNRTIHKLCKFAADRDLEGSTFTEIVDRLLNEIEALKSKTNMLDEGWVMVPREFDPILAEKMALECLPRPIQENDQTWIEIAENAYQDNLKSKKFEIMRTYKELIEQIQGASK